MCTPPTSARAEVGAHPRARHAPALAAAGKLYYHIYIYMYKHIYLSLSLSIYIYAHTYAYTYEEHLNQSHRGWVPAGPHCWETLTQAWGGLYT